MPLVDINLGENLNLIKLPNFLSIDTRPFDRETYEDEIEDDQVRKKPSDIVSLPYPPLPLRPPVLTILFLTNRCASCYPEISGL